MWDLIEKLNRLRNSFSHSLDKRKFDNVMRAFRATYSAIVGGNLENWEEEDEASLMAGALALCVGFLISFGQQIDFYSNFMRRMHRYGNSHQSSQTAL